MKLDLVQEFRDAFEEQRGTWSDSEVELGIRLSKDYAELMGRKLVGEEGLEGELEMCRTGLRNLAVATTITGATIVNRVVNHVLAAIGKYAIGAAV